MWIGWDHFRMVVLVASLVQWCTVREITNIVDKCCLRERRTCNVEVRARHVHRSAIRKVTNLVAKGLLTKCPC